MNCEETREFFSDYLDGSIDAALRGALRRHFDECSSCREELDSFRKIWMSLSTLPEIVPPANFRHDIVMRVARMEHEKEQSRKERSLGFVFGSLLKRFIPARISTVAWIAAAMILVVSGLPERAIHHARQLMSTGPVIQSPIQDSLNNGGGFARYDEESMQSDAVSKLEWESRRMGRNTLWITVDPTQNRDGGMVYRVFLSINERALAQGDSCGRVAVEVYLLPADLYGLAGKSNMSAVWQGSVLKNNPVPVIIDRSGTDEATVNLLVVWKFRGRSFAQIVFMPARYRGCFSKEMYDLSLNSASYMKNRSSLYSSLQGISEDYGVIIVANARITDKYPVMIPGEGKLDWMLRSTLKPIGIDWLMVDHAIYIDRKYL